MRLTSPSMSLTSWEKEVWVPGLDRPWPWDSCMKSTWAIVCPCKPSILDPNSFLPLVLLFLHLPPFPSFLPYLFIPVWSLASLVAQTGVIWSPGWSVVGRDCWPQDEGLACFPELQVLLLSPQPPGAPSLPTRPPQPSVFSTLCPASSTAFQEPLSAAPSAPPLHPLSFQRPGSSSPG